MTRRVLLASLPVLCAAVETPPAVLAWLRNAAIPLKTVEPGQGDTDLAPLQATVGTARIVVLGEGSHGTREIFRLKHRVVEYLITHLGFTHLGLEASVVGARPLNDYVLSGKGDPAALLRALSFWAWDTEELLDLMRWLRTHNTKAAHPVQFVGFDIQHPEAALAVLQADDPSFDPAAVTDWPALLQRLEKRPNSEALVQSARQVRQSLQAKSKEVSRDRSMADNVKWLLDHNAKDAKLLIWTHNGHTSLTNIRGFDPMGAYLRQMYGDQVLLIGSAFNEGSFQTMTPSGMRRFTVEPASPGTLNATLASVGPDVFLIDFRKAPNSGPVAAWLHSQMQMRMAGGTYVENAPLNDITPADAFDAMLFVRHSTPARALPGK